MRLRRIMLSVLVTAIVLTGLLLANTISRTPQPADAAVLPWNSPPSIVSIEKTGENSFQYLVNGTPETFIGMGYNAIYRYLPDADRAANYQRDFSILCQAGVNHITGWDSDKGYEQDKFDELTLDYAFAAGIGVIMPFYLPVNGNYEDEAYRQAVMDEAVAKIERFKDHPALRMWGVGNEVLIEMADKREQAAFIDFYLPLADLFHALDPNHPVIYREAEDSFVLQLRSALESNGPERPWLLYGMNVYSPRISELLDDWPSYGMDRPLLVSEFGAEPDLEDGRVLGYPEMWRVIRSRGDYVIGGAPYVWTTDGPEPVDEIWGLMDGNALPVDDAFDALAVEWQNEPGANRCQ